MEANRPPKAASLQSAPELKQLKLSKATDLPVVKAFDPQENIWTGSRYLGRLLAVIGCPAPVPAVASHPGARRPDLHQDLPPIREIQTLVREVCRNFLESAQEPHPRAGYATLGAERLAELNQSGYCFPVAQPYSFRDTWWDYRSGGRYHRAVDIFAWEGTPVYAITSGVIHQLACWPEAGITLFLRGQDGKGYGYMHLQGYAPGIVEGKNVKAGELLAYVGHTGTKQGTPHLHLQVHADHRFGRDELLNPYSLLVQLCNGKGVTDLSHPTMARRGLPAAEVLYSGTVTLSGPAPRQQPGSQGGVAASPILIIHNY
jgi:murein DD-endopeptidase MepM/ murein hydrolase activator NlpD